MSGLQDFDLLSESSRALISGIRARVSGGSFGWGRCRDDLVFFAERGMGLSLFDWQVTFLEEAMRIITSGDEGVDGFRWLLANTSRQIGKSTMLTVIGLWCVLFNKRPDRRYHTTTVAVVSASDEQAKKLLNEFKLAVDSADRFLSASYVKSDGSPVFGDRFFNGLLSKSHANNTTTISFEPYRKIKHGDFFFVGSNSPGRILSLPPTKKVLGNTFTIGFCDEFGVVDSFSDEFWKRQLKPTGDANRALWIFTSTPWTPNGVFYDFCHPKHPDLVKHIKRLQFPLSCLEHDSNPQAQKQFREVMEDVELFKLDGDWDTINLNYFCKFVKGSKSFFDPEDVRDMFKGYEKVDGFGGLCDVGVDFGGQSVSHTVVTFSHLNQSGVVERLFHYRYPVGKDFSLISDLEEWFKVFNVQRVIVDDCPAGWHFIDLMEKDKGWNVQRMNFSSDKIKKFSSFRAKLKKGQVHSYDDSVLLGEMLSMEATQGARNLMISKANGSTDDVVDSFIISCYFFLEDDNEFKFYEL